METKHVPVRIEQCAKTYADGTRGLHPSTLDIAPGEVMALLGPSGCGKTTLLRLIAGLEMPDAGSRILFDGQDVTHLPIEKREVGMVFQHYALFPAMTVEANIGYGPKIKGMALAERQQRVGELVDLMRLNGLEKRLPSALSGGQRQRVAIARAIANQPRVLLLDEPLAALDAKLKVSLRDELAELLRRLRITAVHVTHDQQEAFAIADRLAVMHEGRIIQIGDGESLYRHPAHPFVATFLGRVNVLQRNAQSLFHNDVRLADLRLPCPEALRGSQELLLRPEDIRVCMEAPAGWARARVQQRSFMGGRVQLTLEVAGQAPLIAEVDRDHAAVLGSTVGIQLNPDSLIPGSVPMS
ncbi:ABC transporter ATP-binding protein [Alcaligenes ammonioxydans]|uniref:ABC transporter ATP-binding protein n=1 Tax=Alcaligenes ammonioxydans TaxID=2582914 RepID=A0ABX8SRS6_9BURK|nr:ABC transporter ATP-binding protein [Alcaligenes ammonioxydans]MCH1878895.1 ABC transporter ATP-binding protein [Alcaligenes ammonioxydans]QXX78726.1 ABC transporter ATP-binding protein [Alcaligenes ammonioxydans]HRK84508.1 ABC transporter ATP-binding protein [Alcaligenes faecalis]